MEIHLTYLFVELNRKCNFKCAHCLRGSARNESIDFGKFNHFIHNIDYITELGIGGGEPSLALNEMHRLTNYMIAAKKRADMIFMVTNGAYRTKALVDEFLYMYYNLVNQYSDMTSLNFSFDRWHNYEASMRKVDNRQAHYNWAYDKLTDLIGDYAVNKHTNENNRYINLIKMGRQKTGSILEPDEIDYEYDAANDELRVESLLYFDVNGNIFSSCDLSYVKMKPSSLFYVCNYKDDLYESIIRYNRKIEKYYSQQK